MFTPSLASVLPPRFGAWALVFTLASCGVYGSTLGWGLPSSDVAEVLFSASDGLERALPALSAAKDSASYPKGSGPTEWWRPQVALGGGQVPAHLMLQMRAYLLKTRTYDEGKTLKAIASLDPRRFDPEVMIYGAPTLLP